MTFAREYYEMAKDGNIFFRRALVLHRVRKIEKWRKLHPFDRFVSWMLRKRARAC